MKKREQKSLKIKILAAVGSMMLIGSLVYITIVGFNYYAGAILAVAVFGLAGPSVVAGDGIMEMIAGFFEMIIEGVMAIVTGIFEAIGSIFN